MTDDITTFEHQLRQMFGAPLTASERELLDGRVWQRLASAQRSPRSTWRRPGRVMLIAAALALVIPLAALGGVFSTEDPFGLADPAEFQVELDAALADVVLPPGRAWPDVPSLNAEQPGVGAYSRGGARSTVELIAFCIWLDDWADARGVGDAHRISADATHLAGVPSWPSWNSPFWTESVRDHMSGVLAAVDRNDIEPVRHELATNCSGVTD